MVQQPSYLPAEGAERQRQPKIIRRTISVWLLVGFAGLFLPSFAIATPSVRLALEYDTELRHVRVIVDNPTGSHLCVAPGAWRPALLQAYSGGRRLQNVALNGRPVGCGARIRPGWTAILNVPVDEVFAGLPTAGRARFCYSLRYVLTAAELPLFDNRIPPTTALRRCITVQL